MSDVSRVEEIFVAAAGRTDSADRAAYLHEACGNDASLRRQVEILLAVQPKIGQFLEPPDIRTEAYTPTTSGENGTIIAGRFKLLEQIGEGGMGEVWVVDQLEPIKRRVALKLIKPGMDSRSILGRFEAERQALAVMDHPNIAKVLDAGTTSEGRPYFVMELVKGTPITDFCDARRLTPQQRLQLFIPVCQAIQHAHMKGIIHRDIKPSNVLVALHDETPVPKVIDFGVAKAIGQRLTEKTIYTGFGALVGTPTYMAPEQANFNQLDVDTRADVYALGVMLYELLAGSPPIDSDRLKKAAIDEVLRIVRDEEPPRPSQRLSTSQAKASIAATRQTEPAKLSALMKGELDWIVMKALEKDRSRRYETANGLAKDVERYLKGDAVEACPPTLGYRLWKAYSKHRTTILIGSAFAALVLAAGILGTYLAYRATDAEKLARNNEGAAIAARNEAEKERDNVTQANVKLNENMDQLQRTRYAAEMNLVQAAYNNKDLELMNQTLLEQVPKVGQPDLRGPEWHYWLRRMNRFEKEFKLPITNLDSGFGNPNVAAFSDDGSKLAYLKMYKPIIPETRLTITIWNTETGKVIHTIERELQTLVPHESFKTNIALNFSLTFHQQNKKLLVNCYRPQVIERFGAANSSGFNSDNVWDLDAGEWKQLQFHVLNETFLPKTKYSENLDLRYQFATVGPGRGALTTFEAIHLADGRNILKQSIKGYVNSAIFDGKLALIVRSAAENQLAGLGAMYMVPTITSLWNLESSDKPIWERRDDPRDTGATIARPVPRHYSLDSGGRTYTELQFTTKGTIAQTYSMETGKLEQTRTVIGEEDLASSSFNTFAQISKNQSSFHRGSGAMHNRIAHISAAGVAIRDIKVIASPIPDREKVMDQEMLDGPPSLMALRADSTLVTLHVKQNTGYLRHWKIPGAMDIGGNRPLSMGVIDPKAKRMANLVFDLLFTDREMPRTLRIPNAIGLFVHDDSGKLLLKVPANKEQAPCPTSRPGVRPGFSTNGSNPPLFSRDGRYCVYVLRIIGKKDDPNKPEHDAVVIHDISTGREVARLAQEAGKAVHVVQLDDQQELLVVATGKKLISNQIGNYTADMLKLDRAQLYEFPSGKSATQLSFPVDKNVTNVNFEKDHWEGIVSQTAGGDRGQPGNTSFLHWERKSGKYLGEFPHELLKTGSQQNEWVQVESKVFGNRVMKRFSSFGQTRLEIWKKEHQGSTDKPLLTLLDRSLIGYLSPDGKRLIVFRDASRQFGRLSNSQDRATMYSAETGRLLLHLPWRATAQTMGEVGCWSPDGLHFWTSVTTEGRLDGYDFRTWEIATK